MRLDSRASSAVGHVCWEYTFVVELMRKAGMLNH